jgi:hypothetical protein
MLPERDTIRRIREALASGKLKAESCRATDVNLALNIEFRELRFGASARTQLLVSVH